MMLTKREGYFIPKPPKLSDYILKHKVTGEIIVRSLTSYVEDDEYELIKRLPEFVLNFNLQLSRDLNRKFDIL